MLIYLDVKEVRNAQLETSPKEENSPEVGDNQKRKIRFEKDISPLNTNNFFGQYLCR